jgi:hypothetical protein
MGELDKFDACLRLAEFGASRHNGRREYEWKVTLGLWAAIVTGIATFRGAALPPRLGLAVVLLYGFLWLRGVWVANAKDKHLSLHYLKQAQELLVSPTYTVERENFAIPWYEWSFGFLSDWSMLFQLLATVGLVRLAYLFIH